jgi:hypothetical protein
MEASPILAPLWHCSPDGSALLGRDGFIFVYGGSNDVVSLYATGDDEAQAVATSWSELFAQRAAALAGRGIAYVQMIIPEKSTVLPDLAPRELTPITPFLKFLEDAMVAAAPARYYLSIAASPDFKNRGREIFRKVDSHLSPDGAFCIIKSLLGHMVRAYKDLPAPVETVLEQLGLTVQPGRVRLAGGDLAQRFFGVPLFEHYQPMEAPALTALTHAIVTQISAIPEGDHIGTRMVYANPHAPLPLKLVAFANSFFEKGKSDYQISWWCRHLFREFHFLWQPEVDYAYIDSVKPDLVICQTIERFLNKVPNT